MEGDGAVETLRERTVAILAMVVIAAVMVVAEMVVAEASK